MGYQTGFEGAIAIEPSLQKKHRNYLKRFSETRRMKRTAKLAEKRPDHVRKAAGLPIGLEGEYFVGSGGDHGQEWDASDITDANEPPALQPGLWCQWEPNDEGDSLAWNGAEKFYYYIEWMKYLLKHFFIPWGYVLNGEIEWRGEDRGDFGTIIVKNNILTTSQSIDSLEDDSEATVGEANKLVDIGLQAKIKTVEIRVNADGRLWVNVDDDCVARIAAGKHQIKIDDSSNRCNPTRPGAVIYPTTGKVAETIDPIPGDAGWRGGARNNYFRIAERMIESGMDADEVYRLLLSCYWSY